MGFHFPTADRLEMELMLLTRWANIALATNFDSSELLGADRHHGNRGTRSHFGSSTWVQIFLDGRSMQAGGVSQGYVSKYRVQPGKFD